ncbi:helix-turn-helix transcriptional regulator [Agilicoccus flavus]|uniref:helix-turn-helix transcriptional regulator n=1 Tax=Agilicoccus flavus TaxID=2775968 RepID=UPI001CF62EB8|nr:WYL domain-containing protein [Agilicoccus flavus]
MSESASTPTAAAAKTERLLNLVICLLYTRRPLLKGQIREAVAQYANSSDEAFDRMFERDKDELRALGIPLVTQHIDTFFDDEPGYRIDRREYALPEIEFAPDEAAALALAARSWEHASLAGPAAQALRKLAASGVEADDASVLGVEPGIRTSEPAFEAVKDAVVTAHPIAFSYRRSGAEPTLRHVQPWGFTSWRGRWYLTGFDTDRGDARVFRVSRIEGRVRRTGAPGSYVIPADHVPRAVVAGRVGGDETATRTARLRVRAGHGHALRRRATDRDSLREASAEDQSWSVLDLTFSDAHRLAEELCWYGPDVVVEEPADVRDLVVARLGAVLRPSDRPTDPGATPGSPAPGEVPA